jgi:tellurite resistance protein TehA-like permease
LCVLASLSVWINLEKIWPKTKAKKYIWVVIACGTICNGLALNLLSGSGKAFDFCSKVRVVSSDLIDLANVSSDLVSMC